MPTPAHIAALDIGTNSVVLLLLRREADGSLHRVLEPSHITRLGEDVAKTGVLKPQAMERTLAAIAELLRELRRHAPDSTGVAVATSAARDAANGPEFLDRCAELIGGRPLLFSGHEEADTMFRGATSDLAPGTHGLCIDIGGGSTELAAGTPDHCELRTSLNLGCVRLGEAHHLFSQATPANIQAARQTAATLLHDACRGMASSPPPNPLEGGTATDNCLNTELRSSQGLAQGRATLCHPRCAPLECESPSELRNSGVEKDNRASGTLRGFQGGGRRHPLTCVAAGGTATTFAAMALGVAPFDPERIHGQRFTEACVSDWAARLLPLTPEARALNPGLSLDRAPVLPAGLLILSEILRGIGASEVTVTTRGLRYGLCLRLLAGELNPTWGFM